MDEADLGNERAEQFLQAALSRRKLVSTEKPPKGRDCDDCGSAIPMKRLRAVPDAERCITCQNKEDRRAAGFRSQR
jgi:DnaK suppressor protein